MTVQCLEKRKKNAHFLKMKKEKSERLTSWQGTQLFGEVLDSGVDAFHAEAGNCLSWLRDSPVGEQLPGAIVLHVAVVF